GIDNEMGDVDILGPKLAGSGLRHRAQTELGAGKGRVTNAAAKARRRSGKEDAAAAAWHHPPRGLPPGEKSRIARHLPDLAEHALGCVEQGKVHVRADVEDAHLKWRVLIGVRQERDDLLLLARIQRARKDRATRGLDLLGQWRKLVAVAPSNEQCEAFGGKFLSDFGADEVARS